MSPGAVWLMGAAILSPWLLLAWWRDSDALLYFGCVFSMAAPVCVLVWIANGWLA